MKTNPTGGTKGSVLVIALLTLSVLTMICATSLYITSQNTSTGMQTGGWQQALTGAEAGIDAAIRALNQNSTGGANAWTNWNTVSTATLPTREPAGGTGTSASAPPTPNQYNYLPSANLSIGYLNSEGTKGVKAWVTIDTAGGLASSTGSWYRIRSTGQATFQSNSVYKRVSNNKLDNDLRNTIALNFNRKGGTSLGPTRTIEVVVQPIPAGGGAKGITMANWLQMTGGGIADSVNSLGQRDTTNPLLVAQGNPGNSAKFAQSNQTYVYGGMVYNGTPPANTNNTTVLGQKSTPDNIILTPPSDPTVVSGQSGHYVWTYQDPWSGVSRTYQWNSNTTYSGGGGLPKDGGNNTVSSITASGTASSPALIIIDGDFTVGGGKAFTVNASTTGTPPVAISSNSYVTIWVKGKFTISGSGVVTQANSSHVTWIIDGDTTVSGDSTNAGYNNQAANASNATFVGVGNIKVTDSGTANFLGTINAPLATETISGTGKYTGAIIGSNLTISGGGDFHYDESLNAGGNPTVGNYAFASWFEDNSDPARGITY